MIFSMLAWLFVLLILLMCILITKGGDDTNE